jgi:hypothetical protein
MKTIATLTQESYLHVNQSSRELGLDHHVDDWNNFKRDKSCNEEGLTVISVYSISGS